MSSFFYVIFLLYHENVKDKFNLMIFDYNSLIAKKIPLNPPLLKGEAVSPPSNKEVSSCPPFAKGGLGGFQLTFCL